MKKTYYQIKERSWIARVAAWKLNSSQVAIVIGRTIHLHNTRRKEFLENKRWVLHELKHIEQFRRHGFLPFIFLYLWESIRHGYTNNKYEIEARAAEKAPSKPPPEGETYSHKKPAC
ncbi:MAG: DUF4157 domain-containing protein [Chitinophagaceae bacterium]